MVLFIVIRCGSIILIFLITVLRSLVNHLFVMQYVDMPHMFWRLVILGFLNSFCLDGLMQT